MRINYIIIAHKNPLQVKRLINRLRTSHSYFYIHINSLVDDSEFKGLIEESDNIRYVPRVPLKWGDNGIYNAYCSAINSINLNLEGYTIILSGEDYPIKNVKTIENELKKAYPTEFISINKLPFKNWYNSGWNRIYDYNFTVNGYTIYTPPVSSSKFYTWMNIRKFIRPANLITLFKNIVVLTQPKVFPKRLVPHGGELWWILTNETLKSIKAFITKEDTLNRYAQYTFAPEEIIFHSIIGSLPDFKDRKVEPAKHFVNWMNSSNGKSPGYFTEESCDELLKDSYHFFARKISIDVDERILDKLDIAASAS